METRGSIAIDVLTEATGISRDLMSSLFTQEMLNAGVIDLDEPVADELVPAYKQHLIDNPDLLINPVKKGFQAKFQQYIKPAVEKDKRLKFKHARGKKKR